MCLDECIELVSSDEVVLRIFISAAAFSRVAGGDLPEGGRELVPNLEQGIRIGVPSGDMHWYLLVASIPGQILNTI
jgi:hypothetical protein